MVIDFHTHIFPDQIAEKTIVKLAEIGNIKAYTDGTLEGLKKSMNKNHITTSVILPVVTKPSQFESVNSFAEEINGKDGIISFGGIHPDNDNYKEKLEQIKRMGLLGIKLHPDYQETFVDDPRMIKIIQYATEIGLIVTIHAGIDVGLPDPVHCTPARALYMLGQIDNINAKIILAHTGGWGLWDEVEELLVGQNIWIDISVSLGIINDEQFLRIVKNHGADRILFASDSPWSDQGETYEYLMKLNLTDEEKERILYRNAMDLLGMTE